MPDKLLDTRALQAVKLYVKELLFPFSESKQDTLVSGANIKTINGQSILGSGDLLIAGSNVESTLMGIVGYDATKIQVLKNVNGTLTWVDE